MFTGSMIITNRYHEFLAHDHKIKERKVSKQGEGKESTGILHYPIRKEASLITQTTNHEDSTKRRK